MRKVYVNDSGNEMIDDDFIPYLIFIKKELLIAGKTTNEIEEYINSFFDDTNNALDPI
ncbi:MAG: hypothetical protein ACOH2A_09710 [Sphingobacteriaceae bacterium]